MIFGALAGLIGGLLFAGWLRPLFGSHPHWLVSLIVWIAWPLMAAFWGASAGLAIKKGLGL